LHIERTVKTPDKGSNLRSCANSDFADVHQSRDRNRAMTPSLLAPCQINCPPGFSTRANSLITRSSSAGCAKKPNEVNRLRTASNRLLQWVGILRMSPRV